MINSDHNRKPRTNGIKTLNFPLKNKRQFNDSHLFYTWYNEKMRLVSEHGGSYETKTFSGLGFLSWIESNRICPGWE